MVFWYDDDGCVNGFFEVDAAASSSSSLSIIDDVTSQYFNVSKFPVSSLQVVWACGPSKQPTVFRLENVFASLYVSPAPNSEEWRPAL